MAATLKLAPRSGTAALGEMPEDGLVRLSLEGDSDAFARLYARYRKPVFAACLRQLRDPELAEDVVQDTFLKAFTHLETFDPARNLLSWLHAIALRRCIDQQRRSSRTDPMDPADAERSGPAGGDATLDAVISAEERRRLGEAVAQLPRRQRRAILLYALEGWSYSDIAGAEGLSLTSTKSLLWRARTSLRAACKSGPLGVLLWPLWGIRGRARQAAVRLRQAANRVSEPAIASAVQSFSLAIALVVVTVWYPAGHGAAPSAGKPLDSASGYARTSAHAAPDRVAGAGRGGAPRLSVRDTANAARDQLLDPTGDSTPENTRLTSIAPSPRFAHGGDATVFAAGIRPCARQVMCSVLFVSRDGGAAWERLPARGFTGEKLLLPPSFPADGRIFAMGPAGLQQSTDGGVSFEVVNPLVGDAAVSPGFNDGVSPDPRILIGGAAVMEYWADRGLMKPAPLATVGLVRRVSLAFSLRYVRDSVIYVGNVRAGAGGATHSVVQRCAGSVCQESALPGSIGVPSLRLSDDGALAAFADDHLFESLDGGRSFRRVALPAMSGGLLDLTWRDGILYAAIPATSGRAGGLFRSSDEGTSWVSLAIDVRGFRDGVSRIVATPTGRLFAAAAGTGIACSDDGNVWAARCASS